MIENRNIICLASNWFYDPTSKHHIMKVLAERNHVIWVNYHGSRRPRVRKSDALTAFSRLRQVIDGPRHVADNMTVITPLVVPVPGNRAVAALNARLLVRQIRSVLQSLPPRPTQVWTFAPDVDFLATEPGVPGCFNEECLIYYCVDEFAEFAGYDRRAIASAEARLAARADLVIASSKALYQSKRRLNAETVLIGHGVDFDHFSASTSEQTIVPDELCELPRPLLGFWGLIQDWVDIDLLASVARLRPQWSLALIGEIQTDVDVLSSLPNVHLLGRHPYRRLPSFARGFDIGLIPFRRTPLTDAVNPIKLKEYLSAGLPVVATPLPELDRYAQFVTTASDAESFVAACDQALADNSPELAAARQSAMEDETWRSKVVNISAQIRQVLGRRNPTINSSRVF